MDDQHRPRPDDHLVEPMYHALHGGDAEQETAGESPHAGAAGSEATEQGPREGHAVSSQGRGCLGLLLVGLLSLVLAQGATERASVRAEGLRAERPCEGADRSGRVPEPPGEAPLEDVERGTEEPPRRPAR